MKVKFIDLNAALLAAFSVLSFYGNQKFQVKFSVASLIGMVQVIVFTDYKEKVSIPFYLSYSDFELSDYNEAEKISFSTLTFDFHYAD